MGFKQFYDADLCYWEDNVFVSVTEVTLAEHERVMLESADPHLVSVITASLRYFAQRLAKLYTPEPETEIITPEGDGRDKLKKYRVSLRYPRTQQGFRLGHYLPDTFYVFASSAKEAQDKALEFVRAKLEPIENDESRRYRKRNFLRDVKQKDLKVKAHQVKTWKQLVDMLGEIGKQRGTYLLDYFDERDLKTILNRAKKSGFVDELKNLTPTQQRMLKKVYFLLAQDPYLSAETRNLLDPSIDKTLRKMGRSITPQPETTPPASPDWPYWSIFEPTEKQFHKLSNKAHTAKDWIRLAEMHGIPARDLIAVVKPQIQEDRQHYDETKVFYRDVWERINRAIAQKRNQFVDKRIRTPQGRLAKSLRSLFKTGADYRSEALDHLGIKWDDIVTHYLHSREFQGIFPYHLDMDDQDSGVERDASRWLWDFIQQPLPRLRPLASYYQEALDRMLQERDAIKSGNRRTPVAQPEEEKPLFEPEDDMPF